MPRPDSRNRRPPRISAIILIVALALVFSLIIFGLGQLNPTGIADLLATLFNRDNDSTYEKDDPDYAVILEQLTGASTAAPTPIDSISLTEAFANFPFAATYDHLYTVTYADGTRSSTRTVSLTRNGEEYRIVQYDGDQSNPRGVLWSAESTGNDFTVQDSLGNRQTYPRGDDFPLSSVALLPDPDLFCAQLLAYEKDPDTSPLSECSAQIAHTDAMRLLILTFTRREDGSTEEYRYLMDYGILYSARGMRNGVIYYALDTVTFNPTLTT
ncbi:MAG: hypothetical protein E7654_09485 [Ruminococcaceae bacterium]|nr:hypothetical protein [Oscillospiraceae bacterium]